MNSVNVSIPQELLDDLKTAREVYISNKYGANKILMGKFNRSSLIRRLIKEFIADNQGNNNDK